MDVSIIDDDFIVVHRSVKRNPSRVIIANKEKVDKRSSQSQTLITQVNGMNNLFTTLTSMDDCYSHAEENA